MNASKLIEVTELGMTTDVSAEPENAYSPISVTVLGIVIFFMPE